MNAETHFDDKRYKQLLFIIFKPLWVLGLQGLFLLLNLIYHIVRVII